MTQEDKELLLKDLCARLPYGVKIKLIRWDIDEGVYINTTLEPDDIERLLNDEDGDIEIKPYLFPLSSMTDEEQRTLDSMCNGVEMVSRLSGLKMFDKAFDWLNKNHFDYRGLIEKGLAIDAAGLNIY